MAMCDHPECTGVHSANSANGRRPFSTWCPRAQERHRETCDRNQRKRQAKKRALAPTCDVCGHILRRDNWAGVCAPTSTFATPECQSEYWRRNSRRPSVRQYALDHPEQAKAAKQRWHLKHGKDPAYRFRQNLARTKWRADPVNRPKMFAESARQTLRRIEKRIEAA